MNNFIIGRFTRRASHPIGVIFPLARDEGKLYPQTCLDHLKKCGWVF
ncbi:hypothetical protein [Anaerolinea sp.]|nr:hypothetical protein [Anaerolinea sp.]